MLRLTRAFEFVATHAVPDGSCSLFRHPGPHRHLWRVVLTLVAYPHERAAAAVFAPFAADLTEEFQGRCLNDVLPDLPTTAQLCRHLYDVAQGHYWDRVVALRVYETPQLWIDYGRE